jgi:hypothetical protein
MSNGINKFLLVLNHKAFHTGCRLGPPLQKPDRNCSVCSASVKWKRWSILGRKLRRPSECKFYWILDPFGAHVIYVRAGNPRYIIRKVWEVWEHCRIVLQEKTSSRERQFHRTSKKIIGLLFRFLSSACARQDGAAHDLSNSSAKILPLRTTPVTVNKSHRKITSIRSIKSLRNVIVRRRIVLPLLLLLQSPIIGSTRSLFIRD